MVQVYAPTKLRHRDLRYVTHYVTITSEHAVTPLVEVKGNNNKHMVHNLTGVSTHNFTSNPGTNGRKRWFVEKAQFRELRQLCCKTVNEMDIKSKVAKKAQPKIVVYSYLEIVVGFQPTNLS